MAKAKTARTAKAKTAKAKTATATVKAPRRTDELRAAAAAFNTTHDEWAGAANRPNPDAIYWDALESLVETFSLGDIPQDCRDLNAAVGAFTGEWDAYEERDNPVARKMPTTAFFAAREQMERSLVDTERRKIPELDSIAVLHAQMGDIYHEQIARMWSLVDRDGEPMVHLVRRELDKPGCVVKAKQGSNLLDGRDWRDLRLDDLPELQVSGEDRKRLDADRDADPCPESPEFLHETGVGVEQAADMLRIPVAEAEEAWRKFDSLREPDKS